MLLATAVEFARLKRLWRLEFGALPKRPRTTSCGWLELEALQIV